MKILPKKSLGQNFLIDNEILNMIADLGRVGSNDIVLEVGPGTGNLTEKILKKKPKKLIVVEKDKNLSIILKKKFNNEAEIINDNILNYNHDVYYNKKIIIFGNLPYNISTQILTQWITVHEKFKCYKKLILMFQKEVADRILAKTNSRNYGRLSIISNWRLNIKKEFNISPQCFFPKPKVDSTLLSFVPKKEFYYIKNPENLEKITRIFFNQRRKMIKNPLKQIFENPEKVAANFKLNVNLRPQNLSPLTYFNITREYERLSN